jgi:hypothetical protein
VGYVVAVPCSQSAGGGTGYGHTGSRADALAASAPGQAWKRLPAGDGAKGPRLHDWALATLPIIREPAEGFERWLLIRRSITDPADLACYLCFGPAGTTIDQLVRIAGPAARPLSHTLAWSRCRRAHQARARSSHYWRR